MSGSASCTAASTASAVLWLSTTAWPGGTADDRVGEVAPAGFAHAQPAQLDVVAEPADRRLGLRPGVGGGGVHQHSRVLVDQPARGGEDDARDEDRGDGVALLEAGGDRDQAAEHRERARHVAREVEGVGAQRGGFVDARGAQRHGDPRHVDQQRNADDGEDVPARVELVPALGQPDDRLERR